jgi:CHAT domain-containing protein
MLKAEALRLAQLGLLNGDEIAARASEQKRQLVRDKKAGAEGHTGAFKADPKSAYAHPYYWAPFILIGNWR